MVKGSGGTRSGGSRNPKGVGVSYGSDWSKPDYQNRRTISAKPDGYGQVNIFVKKNDDGSFRVYGAAFGSNKVDLKGTSKTFTSERDAKEYAEGLISRIKSGEMMAGKTASKTVSTASKTTATKASTPKTTQAKATSNLDSNGRFTQEYRQMASRSLTRSFDAESVTIHSPEKYGSTTVQGYAEIYMPTQISFGDSYTTTLRVTDKGISSTTEGGGRPQYYEYSSPSQLTRTSESYVRKAREWMKKNKDVKEIRIISYYD